MNSKNVLNYSCLPGQQHAGLFVYSLRQPQPYLSVVHNSPVLFESRVVLAGTQAQNNMGDLRSMEQRQCNFCKQTFDDTAEFFEVRRGKTTTKCRFCAREERRRYRAGGTPSIDRTSDGGYVTCVICGDALVQITGSHTQKHGLTFAEYKKQYPDAPTMCSRLQERLRKQSVELWKTQRDRMLDVCRENGKAQIGENNPHWKGGYEKPGGELYEAGNGGGDAKFKARRRAIRVHGHKCMIPGCDFDYVVHNHHITPRSEGGSHDLENCILLCPNHHALADAGVLSRDDLREIVQMAIRETRAADDDAA